MIDKNFNTLLELLEQTESLEAHFMRVHSQFSRETLELVTAMVHNARTVYCHLERELSKNNSISPEYNLMVARVRTPMRVELDLDA